MVSADSSSKKKKIEVKNDNHSSTAININVDTNSARTLERMQMNQSFKHQVQAANDSESLHVLEAGSHQSTGSSPCR